MGLRINPPANKRRGSPFLLAERPGTNRIRLRKVGPVGQVTQGIDLSEGDFAAIAKVFGYVQVDPDAREDAGPPRTARPSPPSPPIEAVTGRLRDLASEALGDIVRNRINSELVEERRTGPRKNRAEPKKKQRATGRKWARWPATSEPPIEPTATDPVSGDRATVEDGEE